MRYRCRGRDIEYIGRKAVDRHRFHHFCHLAHREWLQLKIFIRIIRRRHFLHQIRATLIHPIWTMITQTAFSWSTDRHQSQRQSQWFTNTFMCISLHQSPMSQSWGIFSTKYLLKFSVFLSPLVFKQSDHEFYFHRNRAPLTTVAPQKHYRIVFIKAPTEAPQRYPTIPLQPPDEEKTLVYVLVKKPDPPPEIVLPKPVSTVPTKPEVYFIRYKAQKDENEGPYSPSNSNNPPTNNYPPNTSYGLPSQSATTNFQQASPTLGPPLAAYMINSKPLKNKYNSNSNNRIINNNHIYS